jgi:eukaryotic-like serine/threonine-protein kinase
MADDQNDQRRGSTDDGAVPTAPAAGAPVRQPERRQPEPQRGRHDKSLLGEMVGSIRVVEYIGKGGMGEVYVGFDERLKRKVALKAIRSDVRLHDQARARFLREARMLSQLEHPNICRIYDLVAAHDRDFLVLELLTGTSLKKTIRQGCTKALKFKIAVQVARVLAAAHEKGIVHRDLKPDNVMITAEDDVKVLDFGLARFYVDPQASTVGMSQADLPQGQPRDDGDGGSLATYAGTRLGMVMGTPAYMSPEQARGEPVTPATDLYSFGLLLQELFSGSSPVAEQLTMGEAIERASKGETRTFVDKDRDLVALVSRLKSPAPASRPSALDAADRLQWISQKPRRRHLRRLAAGIAATLVTTAAVAVFQWIRADRAALRAEREAETATQVADFLVSIFEVSDPSEARGSTVTAREILDKGAAKIETELKDQPLVQATMLHTIGKVYTSLGLYAEAEPALQKAVSIRERALGPDHPAVADALNTHGLLLRYEGDSDRAEALFKRALAAREKSLGTNHPDVADCLNNLAWLYQERGSYAQAEPLFKRALAIREETLGPDDVDVASTLNDLAVLYYRLGRYAEAVPFYKRAQTIYEQALGPDDPWLSTNLNNLAALYVTEGQYGEAEPLLKRSLAIREKALGPDHPDVAQGVNNLAQLYAILGRYTQAEPLFQRSLAIQEKALGADHTDVGHSLGNLGAVYRDQGQFDRAEPLLTRSLRILEKALGPDHPYVATSVNNLAALSRGRRQVAAAESLLRRGLAIQEKTLGAGSRAAATTRRLLAACELEQGKLDQAIADSQRCLEAARETAARIPEDQRARYLVASILLLKGQILTDLGRDAEAQSAWTEALSSIEPVAVESRGVAELSAYTQLLLCAGRIEDARPVMRRLLDTGFTDPDLLALGREKALLAGGPASNAKR